VQKAAIDPMIVSTLSSWTPTASLEGVGRLLGLRGSNPLAPSFPDRAIHSARTVSRPAVKVSEL
jgi:hypothetical protein